MTFIYYIWPYVIVFFILLYFMHSMLFECIRSTNMTTKLAVELFVRWMDLNTK